MEAWSEVWGGEDLDQVPGRLYRMQHTRRSPPHQLFTVPAALVVGQRPQLRHLGCKLPGLHVCPVLLLLLENIMLPSQGSCVVCYGCCCVGRNSSSVGTNSCMACVADVLSNQNMQVN